MPDLPFDLTELAPVELPHDFDLELNALVVIIHNLTFAALVKAETEFVEQVEKDLEKEEPYVISSQVASAEWFYEDLRRAERNQTVVSLVTRLDHWVEKLVARIPRGKRRRVRRSPFGVITRLRELSELLGDGPWPIDFFNELVTVRHSVIHHNSRVEWKDKGHVVRVAPRFINANGDLDVPEAELQEAIERVRDEVKAFDAKCAVLSPKA